MLASPLSPYGTLTGQLFLYTAGRAAFESNGSFPNKCILIGGLSDGLLPVPYTEDLQNACQETGWSLVQPILSSSYTGFGHGRLDRDADELEELLAYLQTHRGLQRACLVGHSTGCQDIVHLLKRKTDLTSLICLAALQAPVSDREGHEHAFLDQALDLVNNGKPEEMLPRAAFWAPITAQRYVDLHERLGMDDYFSSDLTDDELQDRLGHISVKMLVACSGKDEYASHLDTSRHLERMAAVIPKAVPLLLPNGNHNLSKGESREFIEKLKEMMMKEISDGI